jgi:hypothetical protein
MIVCTHKHVIIDTASDEQAAKIDRKWQSISMRFGEKTPQMTHLKI